HAVELAHEPPLAQLAQRGAERLAGSPALRDRVLPAAGRVLLADGARRDLLVEEPLVQQLRQAAHVVVVRGLEVDDLHVERQVGYLGEDMQVDTLARGFHQQRPGWWADTLVRVRLDL